MKFANKKSEFIYNVQKASFLKKKYDAAVEKGISQDDPNLVLLENEMAKCMERAGELKEQIEKENTSTPNRPMK